MAGPPSPQILRVGIVGAGAITTNLHLPTLTNLAGVRIDWIADLHAPRAAALAEAAGARPYAPDMLAETDVVLLAIPLPGRAGWLADLAAADAAAMVEKPFANTLAEHEAALALFPDHRLAVGYQRRHYASSRFVRDASRGGWFGRLRRIVHREAGRVTSGGITNYEDAPVAEGGGLLKNLGCHGLDLALHLAGAADARIEEAEFEMDGPVDREVRLRMTFSGEADGCEFDSLVSYVNDQVPQMRYEFDTATVTAPIGPAGRVEIAGASGPATSIAVGGNGGAWTSAQACYLMWKDFMEKLLQGLPAVNSARSALLVTRLIDDSFARAGAPR